MFPPPTHKLLHIFTRDRLIGVLIRTGDSLEELYGKRLFVPLDSNIITFYLRNLASINVPIPPHNQPVLTHLRIYLSLRTDDSRRKQAGFLRLCARF